MDNTAFHTVDLRSGIHRIQHSKLSVAPNTPTWVRGTTHDLLFLKKVIHLIENNLRKETFDIGTLSQLCGVSRSKLNLKLKQLTGETSLCFMRTIKMQRAAQLLLLHQNTIKEVAADVGYKDMKHFRDNFKNYFGVSPSVYKHQKMEHLNRKLGFVKTF